MFPIVLTKEIALLYLLFILVTMFIVSCKVLDNEDTSKDPGAWPLGLLVGGLGSFMLGIRLIINNWHNIIGFVMKFIMIVD